MIFLVSGLALLALLALLHLRGWGAQTESLGLTPALLHMQ